MRVAHAVRGDGSAHLLVEPLDEGALQEALLVEEREAALLGGKLGGGEIGGPRDRLGPGLGELDRARTAVAHAAEDERVGQPGDAEPDAPLGVRLVALLGKREVGHLGHVVHHAHGDRHQALELAHVEGRLRLEGIAHEGGQVDRAQEAGAIGRERLLSAVVHVEAVGVEGVRSGYLNVENLRLAVRRQCFDLRDESLAIELPPIGGEERSEAARLLGVREADDLGEVRHVVAADDELVVRLAPVRLMAAAAIRQMPPAFGPALPVEPRDDAEAQ